MGLLWIGWKQKYLDACKERDKALDQINLLKDEISKLLRISQIKDETIKSKNERIDMLQKNYADLIDDRNRKSNWSL